VEHARGTGDCRAGHRLPRRQRVVCWWLHVLEAKVFNANGAS
jgi:hypothetical protein